MFFAKFNEVSSEAGNLRILLEAPWNLLREKGDQISMRFVCVVGCRGGSCPGFEWLFRYLQQG